MRVDDPRRLDIKLLIAFREVYREGNLTRAAQACGVTQSALSQSLSRMRAVFDDPLFKRTATGMAPTPLAEQIAPEVDMLLGRLGDLIGGRRLFDPASTARTIRFGSFLSAISLMAPKLHGLVEAASPRSRLSFVHCGPEEAIHLLDRGELDIALSHFAATPRNIAKMVFLEDDYVVVSSRNWSKSNAPLDATAYFDATHIAISNRGLDNDPLDGGFDTTRQRRKIAVSMPYYLSALELVYRTDFLLTAPRGPVRWYGKPDRMEVHHCPVPMPPLKLSLAWHKRLEDDRFFRWLIDAISDLRGPIV